MSHIWDIKMDMMDQKDIAALSSEQKKRRKMDALHLLLVLVEDMFYRSQNKKSLH